MLILKDVELSYNDRRAPLAELVDARDSKSRSFGSTCSTQVWGTKSFVLINDMRSDSRVLSVELNLIDPYIKSQ